MAPRVTRLFAFLAFAFFFSFAVEETAYSKPLRSGSRSSSSSSRSSQSGAHFSKHDIALRFLTAFIRLDKNMALQYATPEAVAKLNWNVPHRGNIPYYDDKMILRFNGGWAKVYFQEADGSFRIADFDVHRN